MTVSERLQEVEVSLMRARCLCDDLLLDPFRPAGSPLLAERVYQAYAAWRDCSGQLHDKKGKK